MTDAAARRARVLRNVYIVYALGLLFASAGVGLLADDVRALALGLSLSALIVLAETYGCAAVGLLPRGNGLERSERRLRRILAIEATGACILAIVDAGPGGATAMGVAIALVLNGIVVGGVALGMLVRVPERDSAVSGDASVLPIAREPFADSGTTVVDRRAVRGWLVLVAALLISGGIAVVLGKGKASDAVDAVAVAALIVLDSCLAYYGWQMVVSRRR